MNSRDLIELAVLAVTHAGRLLDPDRPLAESSLENYWTASKCRQQRWHTAFKQYELTIQSTPADVRQAWRTIRPVLDEVLGSDPLTRVLAAICAQRDALRGTADAGPIAHNVLMGHWEARHRALGVLVYGRGSSVADTMHLNRLRRRYEQWSDLLLAALQARCEVHAFAVDLPRLNRFAAELLYQGPEIALSPTWQWIRATLRSSFLDQLIIRCPNGDLNQKLAASLLELLSDADENVLGPLQSAWLERLRRPVAEAPADVHQTLFAARLRRDRAERPALRFDAPGRLRPPHRF